jgi:hypothetical protein
MLKKYGADGQARDDNTTRRMRFARWITMNKDTHSEYVIVFWAQKYNTPNSTLFKRTVDVVKSCKIQSLHRS